MFQDVKYIFFDVGNTLTYPNYSRVLEPLSRSNVSPSAQQWAAVERDCKRELDKIVEHGGIVDHGYWTTFYVRLLGLLGMDDPLLTDQLVAASRASESWNRTRPGTRQALLQIGERYRLGAISNSDGKVRQLLTAVGIADCFSTITDSGIVGCEKPDPRIFHSACREAGALAAESLYVGDVYSIDYLGATRAGMQAILFDVCGAYKNDPYPRVESLEELRDLLLQ
jgi:FMN phosphatase YigB (HAD superfamily)